MLNVSERKGLPHGIILGSMGLGPISSLTSFFRLAEIYHKQAVTLAKKIENPDALGVAYAGLALHNNCLGRYGKCIEYGLQSMKAYREIGDIHGWGYAIWLVAIALTYLGNFTQALAHTKDIVQLGKEGADHHVLIWGLLTQGLIQRQLRQLDEAFNALKEACTLIERTNDYMFSIWVWTELGRVYLRKNQFNQGLKALEIARKFYITHLTEPDVRISQVQLSNNISSQRSQKIGQLIYYWFRQRIILLTTKEWIWLPFRFGIAEAYLLAVEQTVKPEKGYWLKKAGTACQEALRQGKPYRGLMVEAMRMKGTYEWLKGRLSSAEKWWQRSLKRAEELGMSYELGITHLEMGKRLKDRNHLENAEAIFSEIGAEFDLAQTRKLLEAATVGNKEIRGRS
jgi:tetratricopeptide (TPR) repeat protein